MKITGHPRVIAILQESGALRTNGHFVLKSGNHSSDYVDKDMPGVDPHALDEVGAAMAEMFRDKNIKVVVGPQAGGVGLACFVGLHLPAGVRVIYAEKSGDGFVINRAAHLDVLRNNTGEILVCEDIVTTGGSAGGVIQATYKTLVEVFADQDAGELLPKIHVAAICNRGGVKVTDIEGAESLRFLTEVGEVETYPRDDCPLCSAKVLVDVDRGHGRKFLEEQAAREGGK